MSTLAKQHRLAALRASIAALEQRPLLDDNQPGPQSDEAGGFPLLAGGMVQEVFADERRNGGAALGFALAQARGLLQGPRQAVVYLQLTGDAQELGLPYGPGLSHFGFDPAALVLIRPANIGELLWAAEEAMGCRGVAAVVADIAGSAKALDFTASRRLSLRADAGGATLFILRYGAGREASAARLRWHLRPELSGARPFDVRAPGAGRWRARLEKGVVAEKQNQEWLLEWTENGFQSINDGVAGPARPAGGTALSGAVPAQLAHQLPQTA